MLKSQLLLLQESGQDLLAKAKLSAKASDVQTFFELGLRCLADARDLALALAHNSVLLYLECSVLGDRKPKYSEYLDFCARNGLEILSELDFETATQDLLDKAVSNR